MIAGTARVAGELGLHLRAAAQLVAVTARAAGPVRISSNGATVDGKSLLGITSLLAGPGAEVRVEVELERDAPVLAEALRVVGGTPAGRG